MFAVSHETLDRLLPLVSLRSPSWASQRQGLRRNDGRCDGKRRLVCHTNHLVADHLRNEGWVAQLDHVEVIAEAPVHDARLGALFRTVQTSGLAAEMSPYR